MSAATPGASQIELDVLRSAARSWRRASEDLETTAGRLLTAAHARSRPVARINHALMRQERALTTRRGLPGRPWYRHQIYAPGLATGYTAQYLPGLRDAVEVGDDRTVKTYRDLLLRSLRTATRLAGQGAGGGL